MSFFEDVPTPEPQRELVEYRPPIWDQAPVNELPVSIAVNCVLARTEDLGVSIPVLTVYSTGLMFRVKLLHRRRLDIASDDFLGFSLASDQDARFGVRFADGRQATAETHRRKCATEAQPEILLDHGGNMTAGHTAEAGRWLWPIPPEGPLTFAFTWPAEGIEETLVEVDSAPIREAAARAVELWPDDRPSHP